MGKRCRRLRLPHTTSALHSLLGAACMVLPGRLQLFAPPLTTAARQQAGFQESHCRSKGVPMSMVLGLASDYFVVLDVVLLSSSSGKKKK
jgi:hypothetical protein